MSFAICFNLSQSKILSFGKGLNNRNKICNSRDVAGDVIVFDTVPTS